MEKMKKIFLPGHTGWCVSLFMPTHRAGRETEQDPIRFKNLLGEVEQRLLAGDLRPPEVQEMLQPARRLLQDPIFWRHQSDGLAVFFTTEDFHFFRLPLAFEELVVISKRFHIKPLLPILASDGHFYILALSQNQVRLLEGTRNTVDEIELESTPGSLAEAFGSEHSEKQLQFHTKTPSGPGTRAAVFHGHDAGERAKDRVLQWFRMIDKELPNLLADRRSPVVLAGVENLFPLYREANTYPNLLDMGIPGNPEDLKPEELHTRAWPLVEPIFVKARGNEAARYQQLAGTGQTTTDVKEAVLAAYHGRVETLFVAVRVQVWGNFDPDTNAVHVRHEPESGDEDILDLAAIHSLLNGGTVYAVEPDQVPDQAFLAAIFRY
jgi:hypothetical protein